MTPTISMKGYRCVVEDYVLGDHHARTHAHLLSLVGTREAVRAIWARLMKQEQATLHAEKLKSIGMNAFMGGKLITERLPSGAYHGLLIGNACLSRLVLLSPTEGELPGRFHKHLLDTLRLPLHPLWAPWLWEYALARGYLRKLPTRQIHAYDIAVDAPALEQAVRTALVNRELPEVGSGPASAGVMPVQGVPYAA
ncbi:MAG: hypothetical protein M3511_12385 [Deinococcota bacterium]|nr:hypothetical protein [Deinococcota bacterium]